MKKITCLDKGFVRLVDHMGSDESIANAARVSYSGKTNKKINKISDDRSLINYLIRKFHTSPLEMAEFIFHVKLPIFVARQIVRHRTACLTGDTQLWFDEPAAINNNHRKRQSATIKELYEEWVLDPKPIIRERFLRTCNEDNLNIGHTHIKDIWYNGKKPTYKIILENGYTLSMTKDHLCFTDKGWLTLKDLAQMTISDNSENFTYIVSVCKMATNGEPCYQNNVKLEHQDSKKVRKTTKFVKIKSIEFNGYEDVYDLEVEGPYHNFIANGFVVHNSINEISGRYSVINDDFYVPELSRMKKQSTDNKQGSSNVIIEDSEFHRNKIILDQESAYASYTSYLETDMAKEIARINLPLSTYTEWVWKIDLNNLFKFLLLRKASDAQEEVRVYADAKFELIKPIVPYACEAFEEHMLNGIHFGQYEWELIKQFIPNKEDAEKYFNNLGWSKRRINESIDKLYK